MVLNPVVAQGRPAGTEGEQERFAMESALREAKARFSGLAAAASRGERAAITGYGLSAVELVRCERRGGIDSDKPGEDRRRGRAAGGVRRSCLQPSRARSRRLPAGRPVRILPDISQLRGLMEASGRIPDFGRRAPMSGGAPLHVSAVSIRKMRLRHGARHASGGRRDRFGPSDVIPVSESRGATFPPMKRRRATRAPGMPLGRKDSFDELLPVQARGEDLGLLTVDRLLVGHPPAVAAPESGP